MVTGAKILSGLASAIFTPPGILATFPELLTSLLDSLFIHCISASRPRDCLEGEWGADNESILARRQRDHEMARGGGLAMIAYRQLKPFV